jgi:hypothetical protein
VSLRYNAWAKAVYDRIYGKQKTRKKKAAIALARKIAVLAWALLRDEKDWDPKQMLEVTESFGHSTPALKDTLQNMKPKESSDQRKCRLRREAREAKAAATIATSKTEKKSISKSTPAIAVATKNSKPKASTARSKPKIAPQQKASPTKPKRKPKPRRARKLVSAV